jgi:hypothetical protein
MGDVVPGWTEHVIWVCLTLLVAVAVVRILRRLVRRWTNLPVAETHDLQLLRRRETAAAVLTTGARYVVFLIAAFALIGILVEDRLPAAAGATLIVLVLGFGAQRSSTTSSRVSSSCSRTSTASTTSSPSSPRASPASSRSSACAQPCSATSTATGASSRTARSLPSARARSASGATESSFSPESGRSREEYLQEILALDVVGGARFLRPPEVEEERDLGDDLTQIRIRADVPPTMEWLAEDYLAGALEARLEDAHVSKPLVYTLDESAVRRYERTVFVR